MKTSFSISTPSCRADWGRGFHNHRRHAGVGRHPRCLNNLLRHAGAGRHPGSPDSGWGEFIRPCLSAEEYSGASDIQKYIGSWHSPG